MEATVVPYLLAGRFNSRYFPQYFIGDLCGSIDLVPVSLVDITAASLVHPLRFALACGKGSQIAEFFMHRPVPTKGDEEVARL